MSDERKRKNALMVFLIGFLLGIVLMMVLPQIFGGERTDIRRAREMLRRHRYDEAHTWLSEILGKDSLDVEALALLARLHEEERGWDSALAVWSRVVALSPENDTAIVHGWNARIRFSEGDSAALRHARERVLAEADSYRIVLEDRERALALACAGREIVGTEGAEVRHLEDSLVALFPNGEKGYEIVVNRFYEELYPLWYDDELKVDYLKGFLERYPVTEWRLEAYKYLLSSLYRLKRTEELGDYGNRLVREDSLNPLALTVVARVFLRVGIEPETALRASERAMALESSFGKPAHMPEELWALERKVLHGDSRFLRALALIELGRPEEAERFVRDAIQSTDYGPDDEATYGPYFFLLGRVQEALGKDDEAVLSYAGAMVEGGPSHDWTSRADSALTALLARTQGDAGSTLDWARERLGYSGPVFRDVTDEAGLSGRTESRVAFGDYDGDGYDDVLLNGRVLFRNVRGVRFEDVSQGSRLAEGEGSGGLFADFDNDGFLDVFRTSGGIGPAGDRLFRGLGNGVFEDVTERAGNVTNDWPTEGAAWGDANSDGFLDLYLANYEYGPEHTYAPDQFFLNQGDGTFREAARESGLVPPFDEPRAGRGVSFADFDSDGDPDIFVSNYRLHEDFLFRNDGSGSFENVAHRLGVSGEEVRGYYGHTIGADFGDYDGDGDLDLVAANLAHPRYIEFSDRTMLYENQGPPDWSFVDRRERAGIQYDECHANPTFADFDADGDLDLYITSIYENRGSHLYANRGDGTFEDVTWLSGSRAFNGWGCATSDYDKDGDLDLLVGSVSGVCLFENQGNGNGWLAVRVVGSESNRSGIGSRIEVQGKGKRQIREVAAGTGTTSQSSLAAFFGLGRDRNPVTLRIRFPSGSETVLEDIRPDQLLIVTESK